MRGQASLDASRATTMTPVVSASAPPDDGYTFASGCWSTYALLARLARHAHVRVRLLAPRGARVEGIARIARAAGLPAGLLVSTLLQPRGSCAEGLQPCG